MKFIPIVLFLSKKSDTPVVNTISKQVIPDFQKLIDKNDKICTVKRRRRECPLQGSKFHKAPETVGCKGYHQTTKMLLFVL